VSKIEDNSLTLFRYEIPGSYCGVRKDSSLPVSYVMSQDISKGIVLSTSGSRSLRIYEILCCLSKECYFKMSEIHSKIK